MRSKLFACLAATALLSAAFAQAQTAWNFSCGSGKASHGSQPIAGTIYSEKSGYGFDLGTTVTPDKKSCSSNQPFFFSLKVPEGNYTVTVTLGGDAADSTTTVRAEARRLMLEKIAVAASHSVKRTFIVNIRTPQISAAEKVRLKPREIGNLNWDDKLTLEFNGSNPSVRRIVIRKTDSVPVIYIAGDSTAVDQDNEPWAAWGQMLPRFFGPKIVVANNAESGEDIRSFVSENRLDKVMSTMKAGDFFLMQFAHNDQKPGPGFVSIPDYKALMKHYIDETHKRGALPVLVTAMNRREFDDEGKIVNTLGDYPEATREVAKEENVPLVDLNAMSKTLFDVLGPDGTLKAFVQYPANTFPHQTMAIKDNTHFNSYGAYELARCVVEGIRQYPALAKYLAHDAGSFDPAYPDPVNTWNLPASPFVSITTPYGR
jgi:lysophospholipase L1-like esterase